MPLRAIHAEGSIQAFELDAVGWRKLKDSYKSKDLRMPCCNEPAIPKTSKLETFFFAHKSKGNCKSTPESKEHIYCKALLARAAQSAGWVVTTEFAGKTSTGEDWIADVYCTKGTVKIALEVQISKQNAVETLRRQQRYRDSDVRCAWFFGPYSLSGVEENYFDKDTPVFVLKEIQPGQEPLMASFDATLSNFVFALLSMRVKWHTDEFDLEHQIGYLVDSCFKCKQPIKQLYDHLTVGGPLHTAPETPFQLSDVLGYLSNGFPNEELANLGLNRIGKVKQIEGESVRLPYENLCFHCGASQDNYRLFKRVQKAKTSIAKQTIPEPDSLPVGNGFGIKSVFRLQTGRSYWRYLGDQTAHPEAGQVIVQLLN